MKLLTRMIAPLAAFGLLLACSPDTVADESMQWPNGAKVAISLSYDDALNSQLDHAIPALNNHGINASFYLTLASPVLRERMDEWRAAAAAGHELGNHSIYHGCSAEGPDRAWVAEHLDLDKRTLEELQGEIIMANTMLFAIDGEERRTFTPPCIDELAGGENYVNAVAPLFVAVKGRDEGMADGTHYLFFPAGVSGSELIQLVEQHAQQGNLLNILFHGVGGDHAAVSVEAHEELLQYLVANRDDFWVDTYINIMTYVGDTRAAE